MRDELPAEELSDDGDCFEEHFSALFRSRPALSHDVLVEVLAGAEPQEEPAVEQLGGGRRGLRHQGRMDALDWASRHRGAHP